MVRRRSAQCRRPMRQAPLAHTVAESWRQSAALWPRPAMTFGLRFFAQELITGPGRLGVLQYLFRLVRAGLPVPMIGAGRNRYQMVGVGDCARAAVRAVELGCPSGPFNLGSANPPSTRDLLQSVIAHARSRSFLLPMPPGSIKGLLSGLDHCGWTLLYPEQFLIADLDIVLDTTDTEAVLGWTPEKDDTSMMIAAYDAFIRLAN